jgi:hypothetical protein
MAAGAITKAATATPSNAAERSIEVALTDITGLLVAGCRILREYEFLCFFVPSALCLFLPRFFAAQFKPAQVGLMKIG